MSLAGNPSNPQQIKLSQINTELGRSSTAQISLNTAEDGGYATINSCSYYKPSASGTASMSEWCGYNHSTNCPTNGYCGTGGTVITLVDNGNPIVKTVYLGAGPRRFYFTQNAWIHSGQSLPDDGPKPGFSWWRSRITINGSNVVYSYQGQTYTTGSPYNIEPTGSISSYAYLPSGYDTIRIEMEGDAASTIWDIRQFFSCGESGTLMNLHWSPDTVAHACDSNYSYYYFDGVETYVIGFTGYRQYLVIGGFQVGGKISVFPNGTTANSSHDAYGYTGTYEFTFPTYNSGTGGQGYYSDGTNWAYVGSGGTITSVGSCLTDVSITACVPGFAMCNGYYSVGAYASTTVDTSLTVSIYWSGDLGGYMYGSATITSGYTCDNSGTIYASGTVSCYGEFISSVSLGFTPTTSSTQNYITNTGNNGYTISCPC